MEENIQNIVIFFVSIILLFIFPVYVAYEKKDDVAYALALSYTQDFVNEVRNKGYLTKEDYNEYEHNLEITGNTYEIQMEHRYQRIDPIVKCYNIDTNGKKFLAKTMTLDEKKQLPEEEKETYGEIIDTYDVSTEIFDTNHILNVLNLTGTKYTMNVNDEFGIKVKNTNKTLATVMYNWVTIEDIDNNARIYINYSGKVQNARWSEDTIPYAILDKDINNKLLYKKNPLKIILTYNDIKIARSYTDDFTISFIAKNLPITKLYDINTTVASLPTGVEWLIQSGKELGNLQIGVGINGIAIYAVNNADNYTNVLSCPSIIKENDLVEIAVKDGTIALYINNDLKMSTNENNPIMTYKLDGAYIARGFSGKLKNDVLSIYNTNE